LGPLAGIALFDSVASTLPSPGGLSLKWPNDLLLHGGKLGGILIDSALDNCGQLAWVVIGLGVNILQTPTIEGRAIASLAHLATPPDPQTLAEHITQAIQHWGGLTLPELSAAWLARAHPIGTPLTVQIGPRLIHGNFAGLAPDGALLLQDQPTPISSGEIFLPTANRLNA
jgi:BirA family biotin operon repressor/biotin-[acetyl-CoA-carboxylase] ligase